MNGILLDYFRNDTRLRPLAKTLERLGPDPVLRLALQSCEAVLGGDPSFDEGDVHAIVRRVAAGKSVASTIRVQLESLANDKDVECASIPEGDADGDRLYRHARLLEMVAALSDTDSHAGALEAIYIAATGAGFGVPRLERMLDEILASSNLKP